MEDREIAPDNKTSAMLIEKSSLILELHLENCKTAIPENQPRASRRDLGVSG